MQRTVLARAVGTAAAAALLLAGCATDSGPRPEAAPPAPASATPAASATPPAAASAAPAAAPIPVVASTSAYGDIVSRIGGDRVAVTSIITEPGQDPHSYEASTRTQLALSQARVVVSNGGGYDDFVQTMLGGAGAGDRALLGAVDVSGRTAPDGGELNEHVWYDLAAMSTLAGRIAETLGQVEPGSAEAFRANADGFRATLAILTARQADLKSGHAGTEIAVTEPVPLYLLEACGLSNVTPAEFSEAIEEGTDVPIRVLADAEALITSGEVQALIYNEQTTGPQTEQLRAAAVGKGVPVVSVTETLPAGTSYLDWMGANLDAVRDALAKSTQAS